MKKLDLYILKELIVPFLIGTLAVLLMFQANLIIFLMKSVPAQHVPAMAIIKITLLKTPFFLNMTLPVGIALAASLAISRLVRESEMTAFRSAGASILRVLVPVGAFGLVVGVANYLIEEKVMPSSEKSAAQMETEYVQIGGIGTFVNDASVKLGKYLAYIGYAQANGDKIEISDVVLFNKPGARGTVDVLFSSHGVYDKGVWHLKDVYALELKDGEVTSLKTHEDVPIFEPIKLYDFFNPNPQPTEKTVQELVKVIKEYRAAKRDTIDLEIAYHTRYSVPAACFVFALVGPVFAISLGRNGGFIGVLLSIFIVFLYWNMFVISTDIFGKNGWFSPIASAWVPNLVFLILGILGVRRLE